MNPDVGLPRPDICFFLDVSEEVAAKRGGGYGEEIFENQEHQRQVREQFNRCCDHGDYNEWVVRVDAGVSIEEVEHKLCELSLKAFQKYAGEKLESVEELPFDDIIPSRKKKKEDREADQLVEDAELEEEQRARMLEG